MRYFWAILVVLLLLGPAGADTPENVKKPVTGRFEGHLVAMRGHELGYQRPKLGMALSLDLQTFSLKNRCLNFGPDDGYIPCPSPLELIKVDYAGKQWSALRARAESGDHRVTVDVVRKPGWGEPAAAQMWVVIESKGYVTGFAELHGSIK